MNEKQYMVCRSDYDGSTIWLDYQHLDGYQVKPLNRVSYSGIKVNKMILVKPSYIEKVLKKKIQRKLDMYLKFIIHLLENDDDTTPTDLRNALNDLTRYKNMVSNIYRKYLEEKYITLLLNKIALLEQEIKMKLVVLPEKEEEYDMGGKSR